MMPRSRSLGASLAALPWEGLGPTRGAIRGGWSWAWKGTRRTGAMSPWGLPIQGTRPILPIQIPMKEAWILSSGTGGR